MIVTVHRPAYTAGTKTKPVVMPARRVFAYEFHHVCGHLHRCSATWETSAEAEYAERWAHENVRCTECP